MTWRTLVFWGLWALGVPACHPSGADCTGNHVLNGSVNDAKNGASVANAVIVVETGGLGRPTPDAARGNPSYQFSLLTDAAGKYKIDLLCGLYGVHAYPVGYHCGSAAANNGVSTTVEVTALDPNTPSPNIGPVSVSTTAPALGQSVTVTVSVTTGDSGDPLSEEILLVSPALAYAAALDPPSPGSDAGYPDGTYTKTFQAPTRPGSFDYFVIAATRGCVSARATFRLTSGGR